MIIFTWLTLSKRYRVICDKMRASLIAQLVKKPPAMQETLVRFLGQEDSLKKRETTHSSVLGLPLWLSCKESTCSAKDLGLIHGLGRSPRERKNYWLQYSGLENFMERIVHEVAKSWTRLSNFHFDKMKLCSEFWPKVDELGTLFFYSGKWN